MAKKFEAADLTRWKQEINPAPILSARIKIEKRNSDWWAVCPFHNDKNPSFEFSKGNDSVWFYKCYGCGATGNIFQFVQKFDKVSFSEAVTSVLKEAGVSGWQDGQEQEPVESPVAEPKECETFPIAQYQPAIVALERSPEAQAWLAKRGIGMAVARQFKLGFVQSAEKITRDNDWITDGWILFPTISADGQTITAVKYRSLVAKKKKKTGKKENSGILRAPNTSTTLYNFQTVRETDDVWIVEGEPDTLVLAQAGLTTVGYPMAGYTPSDEECDILSAARRRFLAGDNDSAGTKAMEALQKRLRGAMYVIKWPNGRKDANDVLTNECGNDPEKFKVLVEDLKARATQTQTEPIFRNGNEIEPRRINWLWHNKIPMGKQTLFAGNPGNGKALAASSVAAYVTIGKNFPESETAYPPSDVIMMVGEDDLEDTAVPRLMAAGADMKRIHFLVAARPVQQEDREVRLDMDIPAIEKKLAANSNIRLVVIDPISNYLGDVSMVAEQEVRGILIPLKRLAENFNVAVLIVMHLNKKNDLDAISRVGGAMAFIGVARCSWLFVRDPKEEPAEGEETPKDAKPDTFSMLRIKNNLVSANKAGMSYSVAVKNIPVAGEKPIVTPYIVWGNAIEGSADDALNRPRRGVSDAGESKSMGRPNTKLQVAVKWLGEALQDGAQHDIKQLRKDAHDSANISSETLDRAYESLGGKKAVKIGRFWYWQVEPMNETGDENNEMVPEQSSLIAIEGAE